MAEERVGIARELHDIVAHAMSVIAVRSGVARMLIDTMSVDEFEPQKFSNNYHDALLTMIEARAAGKELPKAKKAPARSKVVNLMDVLAQSLEASKKRRSGTNGKPAEAKRRKKTAA